MRVYQYNKKRVIGVTLAAIALCIGLAVCLFVHTGRQPLSLGGLSLEWAQALDLREEEPNSFVLDAVQLDMLEAQLACLEVGERDNTLAKLTPLYAVDGQSNGESFSIQGLGMDGEPVVLYWQGDYYRMEDNAFSTYLRQLCTGIFWNGIGKHLTLEDVYRLSGKGEQLTWSDFAGFAARETGSGLYILYFEMEPPYTLLMGGVPNENAPMYIRLYRHFGTEEEAYVDIRTEDTHAFVESPSSLRHIPFESSVCWVNYAEEDTILYQDAQNLGDENSGKHLPVFQCKTAEELESFCSRYAEVLDFSAVYDDYPSFYDLCQGYDAPFFAENALLLVYVPYHSGSYHFDANHVCIREEGVELTIVPTNVPEAFTNDMAGWLVCVAVEKAAIQHCHYADAILCGE